MAAIFWQVTSISFNTSKIKRLEVPVPKRSLTDKLHFLLKTSEILRPMTRMEKQQHLRRTARKHTRTLQAHIAYLQVTQRALWAMIVEIGVWSTEPHPRPRVS